MQISACLRGRKKTKTSFNSVGKEAEKLNTYPPRGGVTTILDYGMNLIRKSLTLGEGGGSRGQIRIPEAIKWDKTNSGLLVIDSKTEEMR